MNAREALLATIQAQAALDPETPPVVTLDEYFADNRDEECIAPNQVGDGRPILADFYSHFQRIQAQSNVQIVLVGIHGDWVEALKYPDMWPAAENIHIYTSASADEVEEWISGLAADGAGEGWPYGKHPAAPEPTPGFKVITVYWD
jgi:predicted SnoaL-like aldol condensation-catalyzing enzyme